MLWYRHDQATGSTSAKFALIPHTDPEITHAMKDAGLVAVPGVLNPSEKEAQRKASGKNKSNAGRKGYAPCFILKICHFHKEFGLSDKKMVIRLYDSCLLRQCLGIESPDDIPSEETMRNYRKLFAQDDFMDKAFHKATAIMQEQAEETIKE